MDTEASSARSTEFYVGGSTKDINNVQYWQGIIKKYGGVVGYDWTTVEGNPLGQEQEIFDKAVCEQIAKAEIQAAATCDVCLIISPIKRFHGLGCWIEAGAALAAGAKLWVYKPFRDSIFWVHPNTKVFYSNEDLELSILRVCDGR